MAESSLSPREKVYNHTIGRILDSHLCEVYPKTTAFFKSNEVYFDELVKIIDQANAIMVSKIHEGLDKISAREYAVQLAYDACQEAFLEVENNFSEQSDVFDIDKSGFIDSTQLN
tara:strand:+ start:439 stop:783 length:345 start_codon:yes stop_codon:yes gene_type:complete